jgi:ubiquitin-protein ligase
MLAVDDILADREDDDFIEDALNLPIDLQYRALLAPRRFDYMDIDKYHYDNLVSSNSNPPPAKMVRLAQELADISNALPTEHTNAVFVRVDRNRVDKMKCMITGSTGTPYAHGMYEYDMFFENSYPQTSPKMNLTTTGNGQIRFNPNLYACGKVCLSLLGTWRG